jgi:hypothetical protein
LPISAALKGELGGEWTNKGPFNLRAASIPIAVLAILGCALLIFVGVQPPQEKVGYLIVLMILGLAAFWFSMESKIGIGVGFAVLTVLAVYERKAPVTINLENQDPEIPLDVVTKTARDLPSGSIVALSNSFGFGGHNAVIAVRSI